MTSDLQTAEEIGGIEWVVDFESEPPQRLVKIEYDTNTLISLIDVADAATFAPGATTRQNAELFRDYLLRVVRELESRSMIDYKQWKATAGAAE